MEFWFGLQFSRAPLLSAEKHVHQDWMVIVRNSVVIKVIGDGNNICIHIICDFHGGFVL